MDLPVMVDPRMQAVINAPFETIDLTEWVFGLTDGEYQACSKDHIAPRPASRSTASGFRSMSSGSAAWHEVMAAQYGLDTLHRNGNAGKLRKSSACMAALRAS
jgi:hypothetical protein